MMKLLFGILFFTPGLALADLDPASPLLRGRGTSPTIETLDSGRFVVKPAEERKQNTGRSPRSHEKPAEEKAPATTETVSEQPETKVEVAESPAEEPKPAPHENPEEISQEDSNLLERLRVLILGVNDEELEALRTKQGKHLDAENSVEIYLAPSYLYYNSSSSYSVRNYSSSSPGYTAGLSLWFSPYFGLEGEMQSSLGASLNSLTDDSVNPLSLSKNRIGLTFRSIDLKSPLSPQTLWRISYTEFSARTSSDTGGRVSTKSSGVQIAFEAKLPSSKSYSHRLGVSIEPRLSHKESSGSQNIRSGKSSSSSAIAATVGGEIKFNRKSQVYWSIEHRYERNLFKGESNYADPESGFTPDGLNVDQSLTLFSIGYRWGK